eukprot:CAMPEP_0114997416 /NCGR_PEP_ID=MMETSP0216-20121206/14887_1 /TAXON_ID=223996 /ORGANISM="Protocruzia adherens, Strain Boccale" /LENGTH=99 /DNA_ID=CAMNT_0002361795 /DNA_START=197 /DNA_END=496 /DNA_ORIENTATION=-
MPIRKDDEVMVMRGGFKGHKGKVTQVYRKKYSIFIEKLTRDKANGQNVNVPIHPSNVQIIDLKLNKDRKNLLERKAKNVLEKKNPEKYTGKNTSMQVVD